jgi:hypothetical protein
VTAGTQNSSENAGARCGKLRASSEKSMAASRIARAASFVAQRGGFPVVGDGRQMFGAARGAGRRCVTDLAEGVRPPAVQVATRFDRARVPRAGRDAHDVRERQLPRVEDPDQALLDPDAAQVHPGVANQNEVANVDRAEIAKNRTPLCQSVAGPSQNAWSLAILDNP